MKFQYVIIALGLRGTLDPDKNNPELAIYQDTAYPEGYKQLKKAAKWAPVGLWVEILPSKKALATFRRSAKGKKLLRSVAKAIVVQIADRAPAKGKRKASKRRAPAKKAE